jgi:hypothetical protein
MTKIFTALAIFCILAKAQGQKLKRAQARQILETAVHCLKTSDSIAFIGLWHFDGKPAPYHKNPFTEETAASYYHYFREFLDTALTRDLKIDYIEISKVPSDQQALNFGKYNIRAWLKYNDKYYKGFGFFVDYIDHKWVVHYIPDTMSSSS